MNSSFKFSLQEEKFNELKKLGNFNINSLIGNALNRSSGNIDEESKSSKGIPRDSRYEAIIEGLKGEINVLKQYIERINKEVRKNMRLEIPQILNTDESDQETLAKFFEESISRMINPDYLNPLFSIYDKYIEDLESEVKSLKSTCSKYETVMSELTKENSVIRDKLSVKQNEMREMLRLKIEGSNRIIPLDIEYVNSLEERSDLLSKENEILAFNFQKVSRDLFEYKATYIDKYSEFTEKTEAYDIINERLDKITMAFDSAVVQNRINENTIINLTESVSRLEIENEKFRIQTENFRRENYSLHEANNFYKNFLNK